MAKTVLDSIPKAQRYKDKRSCGQPWREMEKVADDEEDYGDLYVKAETHMIICKDIALAMEMGKAHIGVLQREREMLIPFLNYVAILRNKHGDTYIGKQMCKALKTWENRKGTDDDED